MKIGRRHHCRLLLSSVALFLHKKTIHHLEIANLFVRMSACISFLTQHVREGTCNGAVLHLVR